MYDESTTQLMALANLMNVKDSRWLQLEVCREFQRGQCSRTENDCKFSHPPPHVEIQNGRVTACYDSIKGRCTRENPKCKYLHPPQHLKDQLLINGRNNLAIKNLLMNQFTTPTVTAPLTINPLAVASNAVMSGMAAYNPYAAYAFNPAAAVYPNLVASPDVLGSIGGVLQAATTPVSMAAAMASLQAQKSLSTNNSGTPNNRSDRVEVCRDHLRSACPRSAEECKFAHPDPVIVQKNGGCSDGMITVCMDYVLKNGACTRENCRYFHPPSHLTLKSSSFHANGHAGSNTNGNSSSGSQSRDESSSSPMTTTMTSSSSSAAMQQPAAMSAAVAVAQALAARAAAANAAAAAAFPTAAAYQSLLAASTQSQMAAAAMHAPRNFVVNQSCLSATASPSTAAAAAAAFMANRGATLVTNDGHANPKKRALEIDNNNGYSTTDPYLLAAAQALSSTTSAKRAALDKSGVPFYQPTITAATATAYPFNLQQYQQLAPTAAAIPTLPGASYFPATAFTPPFFLSGGNMASSSSMIFNMPTPSTLMYSNVVPLEQHVSSNISLASPIPVNLASVAYYDEMGQLLDTLPVCRDFKQGHCDRSSCRYVHLYEDYVEISDGKVTVCRDFAKGKCVRSTCKYYHVPLLFNQSLQSLPDTVNVKIIPNSITQPTPSNRPFSMNPLIYQILQQDNKQLNEVLCNQSS